MIHGQSMPIQASAQATVLCQGAFTTNKQRDDFLLRNSIDDVRACFVTENSLYGSIGFPFQKVEEILDSEERFDFLYILVNSPLSANFRVYDEYVFKNFPCTTKLFKQIRDGGDTFVFKKKNRDVLFVKFHNIYEAKPLLHMTLQ